jgi:GTP pyrophosphokinase
MHEHERQRPLSDDGATGEASTSVPDTVAAAKVLVATACDGRQPLVLAEAGCISDLLQSLDASPALIAAGHLLPAARASLCSHRQMRDRLTPEIADLTQGAQRLDRPALLSVESGTGNAEARAEALRKLVLALVDDPRVVLISLAGHLVALRDARQLETSVQRRLGQVAREIYAPLANRLGIWQLKWETEDLAFRFLEPEPYHQIASGLQLRRAERERYVTDLCKDLQQMLADIGIQAEITGRPKHIYSIFKKMRRKELPLEQLYDLLAVRVVVGELHECYAALGVVHGRWHPVPGEFDDYVANPKGNDYRSLHTAIVGPQGHPVEIQIRTQEMHDFAELGVAAHWRYKEGGREDPALERKIGWLRQLLEPEVDAIPANRADEDFIDRMRGELLEERVYVLTPEGDVVDLPQGATPLDFAYYVHTSVGHRCRGAKVNGRMVQLTHTVATGDQVEIQTAREPRPSRDWLIPKLGYIRSTRARSKVRHWFRQQDRDFNLAEGRALLDRELRRLHIEHKGIGDVAEHFNKQDEEGLCVALGRGDVTSGELVHELERRFRPPPLRTPKARPRRTQQKGSPIEVAGLGGLVTQVARCCNPVPGESIAGFVTLGRGITVHSRRCANLRRLAERTPDRVLDAVWTDDSTDHVVTLTMEAEDRKGLLTQITDLVTDAGVGLRAVQHRPDPGHGTARIELALEVTDVSELERIMKRLRALPGTIRISRGQ